jgi:hypothetical protein
MMPQLTLCSCLSLSCVYRTLQAELEAVRHELKVDVGNARGEVSGTRRTDANKTIAAEACKDQGSHQDV